MYFVTPTCINLKIVYACEGAYVSKNRAQAADILHGTWPTIALLHMTATMYMDPHFLLFLTHSSTLLQMLDAKFFCKCDDPEHNFRPVTSPFLLDLDPAPDLYSALANAD